MFHGSSQKKDVAHAAVMKRVTGYYDVFIGGSKTILKIRTKKQPCEERKGVSMCFIVAEKRRIKPVQ